MADDYISRRTAINGIEEYYKDKKYIKRYLKILTAICLDLKSVIDTLPSVDVQPVVRCKDCKYHDPEDKKCDCGHDIIWQSPRDDSWYCADGELKNE